MGGSHIVLSSYKESKGSSYPRRTGSVGLPSERGKKEKRMRAKAALKPSRARRDFKRYDTVCHGEEKSACKAAALKRGMQLKHFTDLLNREEKLIASI